MYIKILSLSIVLISIFFQSEIKSLVQYFPNLEQKKKILEMKKKLTQQEKILLKKLNTLQIMQKKLNEIKNTINIAKQNIFKLEIEFQKLQNLYNINQRDKTLTLELKYSITTLKNHYTEYENKYKILSNSLHNIKNIKKEERANLESKIDTMFIQRNKFILKIEEQINKINFDLNTMLTKYSK